MSLHLQLVLARSSGFDFIEVIDEGRGNKNDKKHHLPVIQSDLLIPYFWFVVSTDPKNISQIGSFPQVVFFGFGA